MLTRLTPKTPTDSVGLWLVRTFQGHCRSFSGDSPMMPGIRYAYDTRGNRVSMDRTDDGVSRYQYDEISQLVKAELADGDLQVYTFDPVGNRMTLTDRRGVQAYSYDDADQLQQIESTFNPAEPEDTKEDRGRSRVVA